MWRTFRARVPEGEHDDLAHPLDSWVRGLIGDAASRLGAEAVFPFDGPPFPPFQRWATRAEPVYPSPIGILIHPEYGLWHAYRGALVFREVLPLPRREKALNPCKRCRDKPCLAGCPVGAFGPDGYDVPECVTHLRSPAGAPASPSAARHATPVRSAELGGTSRRRPNFTCTVFSPPSRSRAPMPRRPRCPLEPRRARRLLRRPSISVSCRRSGIHRATSAQSPDRR